jgi:hypothetical protein
MSAKEIHAGLKEKCTGVLQIYAKGNRMITVRAGLSLQMRLSTDLYVNARTRIEPEQDGNLCGKILS